MAATSGAQHTPSPAKSATEEEGQSVTSVTSLFVIVIVVVIVVATIFALLFQYKQLFLAFLPLSVL